MPRHDTSSISYRKCITSNKFFFQAIYSQTYVSLGLPTPIIKIARSHLVVSRNFRASKHEAFDKWWEKRGQDFAKKRPGKLKTILYGQIIKKRERKNAYCVLTDTLFPVWRRSLVTRVASTRIATIIIYAAVFAPSIVKFTLVTVYPFCATPSAVTSAMGRGWVVTISMSCSVGTWAWRQFPRGWLPGSPMAIPWG